MIMRAIVFGATVGAAVFPRPLAAQRDSVQDVRDIEVATATYLRGTLWASGSFALPATGLVFETRTEHGYGHWVETRSAERIQAILGALRATAGHTDSILVCTTPRDPSTCGLRHASALVAILDPVVSRDTARVVVRREHPTGLSRVPLQRVEVSVTLVRESGKWRVVGSRILSIT